MYVKQLNMAVNYVVYQQSLEREDSSRVPIGAFIMGSDAEAFVSTLGQCSSYRVFIEPVTEEDI